MAKDYYVILGVDPDATLDQIKSAYRKQAKRCHPDLSREGCEPFLVIQEAYDVLGDAGRRKAYDEELARERRKAQRAARAVGPEPIRRRRRPVEPLVPTQRPGGPRDPFSAAPFSSFIEELFGRPWRDPDTPVRTGGRRDQRELHVQVSLTREEALHGGRIRLWIQAQSVCPACRGWGGSSFFACQYCYGSGTVHDEHPVDVTFPGGLADGVEGTVSLSRPGMADLSLVLHFRVDDW